MYGDIVRQVAGTLAGTRVRITSIISDPAADPHSYEANVRTQLELSRSALVVENGGGYDDFVDTMLRASTGTKRVINAVQVSGKARTAGAALNEHVWYDLPTVARLAAVIDNALADADRPDAATFHANAAAFVRALGGLEADEAAVRKSYAGVGVAITEPVPGYLLNACGLVDRTPVALTAAIEEGRDAPASVLQETLQLFARHQVRLLAYNAQTSGPQTTRVIAAARSANIAVIPVTETLPAATDYLSWMRSNVAAVAAALR